MDNLEFGQYLRDNPLVRKAYLLEKKKKKLKEKTEEETKSEKPKA
jgi:GrpB-like predicted nucleotidyltransferase (UPF0157 family)